MIGRLMYREELEHAWKIFWFCCLWDALRWHRRKCMISVGVLVKRWLSSFLRGGHNPWDKELPLELLRNGLTRSIIVSKQWGTSAASQGHAKVTGGGRCGQRPRRILTKRELVACHDPFASHRRHFYWPWLTWSHIVMKTRARPCLELVWFWSVQFTKFKH